MDISYEIHFLQALGLTILIETLVLCAVVRFGFRIQSDELRTHRCIIAGTIASGATLPYLWFVAPVFLPPFALRATIGEPLVTIIETLILAQVLNLTIRRSLIASLAANGISFGVGLIIVSIL